MISAGDSVAARLGLMGLSRELSQALPPPERGFRAVVGVQGRRTIGDKKTRSEKLPRNDRNEERFITEKMCR